ncbi:MAG TPA: thioredoxin family protein [Burkholderiaceae bacterium]|nr:thioredoxin family protein [Burkholderiaceae bacterium]HQR70295.1 thioredoxin family protein [Burkholderiaceae bacterium]
MKIAAVLTAAVAALSPSAWAAAVPGQSAPDFRALDTSGKAVSLADFRGRTVVLEWSNPNCPFVQKHYVSGNMQALQHGTTGSGVVWLAINSTNDTHSDYMSPAKLGAWFAGQKAAPTAVLMDTKGEIGRAYGAKVTPHMYVIDPQGIVIYAGAIDDKRSANPADVKTATNYVAAALADTRAGKHVATAASNPYGCTIKY